VIIITTIETINYSEFYPKLALKVHTTIRTHLKWKFGQILNERVNGRYIQQIQVIGLKRELLKDFGKQVLFLDTNRKSMLEVHRLFNSFKIKLRKRYKNKKLKLYNFEIQKFTLYTLRIINQPRITDYINIRSKIKA